tara:strand:+ start:2129 stop:2689 length:561 start_codon:yes stop_codon:yes gene_type:complete
MTVKLEPELDLPIPGMALTHELGARPWQSPPQYATVEDALDFYLSRIGDDRLMYNVLSVVENGVAIPTIAETLTLAGVMEGKHTIDTAVLANPVITEFIKGLADTAGVEYTMDAQKSYIDMDITENDLNIAEEELRKEQMLDAKTVDDLKYDLITEIDGIEEDLTKKGLMARREPLVDNMKEKEVE